jgi:TetR/AcrR family transcriptional regulator, regulator of cefoperazone and chloramphenicol sensitivity
MARKASLSPRPESSADARSHATRQRLVEVALDVFAERGFRAATVREICARAGANIAAVSYHFGDKVGLYRAVIGEAKCHADEEHPTMLASTGSPEEDLKRFIRAFVNRLLIADACATHGKLMAWEMVDPTGVLDEVVRDAIRPTWEHLSRIVAANLGVDGDDPKHEGLIRRATTSVMGQVLIYRSCRAVVDRLHPNCLRPEEVAVLAEHIAEFSLHGLAGMKKGSRR